MTDLSVIKNFILLFFIHKKEFFMLRSKDIYNLIIINKNLLSSKNRSINKKN